MGICCKGNNDDNDLEYIPIPQNKIENKKKNNKQFSFLDSQNQSGYINGIENIHKVATDFKQNENQIQISNIALNKNNIGFSFQLKTEFIFSYTAVAPERRPGTLPCCNTCS